MAPSRGVAAALEVAAATDQLGSSATAAGGAAADGGGKQMLTGNEEVVAEIMAFYQARESLIKKRMAGGKS